MEMVYVDTINDPIWGEISITAIEKSIIKTDIFCRLRNIKQMSMAYINHVGAQHTRYEHSIGCMHVAYNLAKNIKSIDPKTKDFLDKKGINLNETEIYKHIRIAALLHDIGHSPMSHLLESAVEKYPAIITECLESDYYKNNYTKDNVERYVFESYSHESFTIKIILTDNELVLCNT